MANAGRATEHTHKWKIVMLGDEPIGLSCKCGESRPVTDVEHVCPKPFANSLKLAAGSPYTITWDNNNTNFTSSTTFNGNLTSWTTDTAMYGSGQELIATFQAAF